MSQTGRSLEYRCTSSWGNLKGYFRFLWNFPGVISLPCQFGCRTSSIRCCWSSSQPVLSGEFSCSCWFNCLVKTFLLVCRENGLTPSNAMSAYTEGRQCLAGYACLISFVWIPSGSSTQVLEFLRKCLTSDDLRLLFPWVMKASAQMLW